MEQVQRWIQLAVIRLTMMYRCIYYSVYHQRLGYNWDKDDYIAAYFPEVGIVMDFTKTFGITVSGKRYFNLYEEDEDIVMLGLVFRK